MNNLKIFEKLSLEIEDILDEPKVYYKTVKGKDEQIFIYPDRLPVNPQVFFIQLSALLKETEEKNNLFLYFENKSERLFRYLNENKHDLPAHDIDRILINRNCNDDRDLWILNTFLFAVELKIWIQDKKESLRIEKVNQLNITVRKIEKQISTTENKNLPNEEKVKTELAKIIKPLYLDGFVKNMIKYRDEYIHESLINKKLNQKGCHAAFYLQIFKSQNKHFKAPNGKTLHFTDIQNIFDLIFCIDTKKYKPKDLSESERYLQSQYWITQISKA
jgi:hypothetical protein